MTQARQTHCFACGRRFRYTTEGEKDAQAITSDGQTVYVGWDCLRKINSAGSVGYQPPKGGPRLFQITKEKMT